MASHQSPGASDGAVASGSPALVVNGLRKSFDQDATSEHPAIDGLSFTVDEREFVTLLGPSGCGKSTTLRCIAGLEAHDEGEVWLYGQLVSGEGIRTTPAKRRIGFVFQQYAIWPHMTVQQNVAFAAGRASRDLTRQRVREALEMVGMWHLASRPSTALSGGQQQRVAIARAIVMRPRVLLLDEPFSNLDAKLRKRMRAELREVHRLTGLPTVYVTHDQEEALAMSDRIIVMRDGRCEQEGSGEELVRRPQSRFVADFIGDTTLLEGTVTGPSGNGLVSVRAGGVNLHCTASAGVSGVGQPVDVALRPWDITLQKPDSGRWNGVVENATYLGSRWEYQVRVTKTAIITVEVVAGVAGLPVGSAVGLDLGDHVTPVAFPR